MKRLTRFIPAALALCLAAPALAERAPLPGDVITADARGDQLLDAAPGASVRDLNARIALLNDLRNNTVDASEQAAIQSTLRALFDQRDEMLRRHAPALVRVVDVRQLAPVTPYSVLAQLPADDVPPTVSKAPSLLDQFLTPGGIATAIGIVLGIIGALFANKAVWKRRLALVGYHAYQIVNDIDDERGDDKLDKAKEGLRVANEYMVAHGWRPLKPGEQQQVLLQFQSLHGEEKQQVKVQAEAQAKVAAALTPAPKPALAASPQ